jgi:preprotein translocase subunit SecE
VPDKKANRQDGNIFLRFGRKIQQLFRETIGELRKVSWPTRQEASSLTKIVLAVILVMGIFLGILDIIFAEIIALFLRI